MGGRREPACTDGREGGRGGLVGAGGGEGLGRLLRHAAGLAQGRGGEAGDQGQGEDEEQGQPAGADPAAVARGRRGPVFGRGAGIGVLEPAAVGRSVRADLDAGVGRQVEDRPRAAVGWSVGSAAVRRLPLPDARIRIARHARSPPRLT